jgi:hypothetical protein
VKSLGNAIVPNYHLIRDFKTTTASVHDSGSVLVNASVPMGYSNIIPLALRSVELTLTPEKELKPEAYHIEATVVHADGAILASKKKDFAVK